MREIRPGYKWVGYFAACLLMLCFSCGPKPEADASTTDTKSPSTGSIQKIIAGTSVSQKLAIHETGKYAGEKDMITLRFVALLDKLEAVHDEDAAAIADLTLKAVEHLRTNGINERPLKLMEGIEMLAYPLDVTNRQYSFAIGLYVMGRRQGRPHIGTLQSVQQIILSP